MTDFKRTHSTDIPVESDGPRRRIVFEVEDSGFAIWENMTDKSEAIKEMVEVVGSFVDRVIRVDFLEEQV